MLKAADGLAECLTGKAADGGREGGGGGEVAGDALEIPHAREELGCIQLADESEDSRIGGARGLGPRPPRSSSR
jgi:hypothetical protein